MVQIKTGSPWECTAGERIPSSSRETSFSPQNGARPAQARCKGRILLRFQGAMQVWLAGEIRQQLSHCDNRRSKDGEVLESDEDCWRRLYDQCIRHFDDDNEHNLEKPLFALKQPPSLTQLCAAVDAPAERLLARLSLRQASPAHIVDVSRTIKLCRDVVRAGAPTLERKRRKESGAGCVGGAGGSGDGGVGGGGTIVGSGGSAGANDRTSDRQAKRHKSVPQVSLPLLPPAAPGRPAPRRPPRPRRCPPPAHDLWPTCPASLPSPRQRSQCKRTMTTRCSW